MAYVRDEGLDSAQLPGSLRTALVQQHELRRKITELLSTPHEEPVATQMLESANAASDRLETFFRSIATPLWYNEQCPSHAEDLAQRVFDIPELLESILIELRWNELLGSMLVNRQFRDAVLASKRLKRRLSLVPDPDAELHAADFTTSLLNVRCRTISQDSGYRYNPLEGPPVYGDLMPYEDGIDV
ncbi:hypothetical protein LTR85_008282 [Meristemomyces frigidus]|nr:hypothetical protein LTR85_008282 [Meristemomyces frigidus]